MPALPRLAPVYEMLRYRSPTPNVVIIDDQSTGRMVLSEVIKSIDRRINTVMLADPEEAIEYVRNMPVDLVLTDYRMPRMNGIETTRALREMYPATQLPIIMTTVIHRREILYQAFNAGVSDYLLRPVDPMECRMRCENLLRQRGHVAMFERQMEALTGRVEQISSDLQCSEEESLHRLTSLIRLINPEAAARQRAVASYAAALVGELGGASQDARAMEIAACVHDIGELALPPGLCDAARLLDEAERTQVRRHPGLGHEMLRGGSSRVLQAAAEIALGHHERFDGSGYPRAACGSQIPLNARIVAVADVFHALTSPRHYRPARSLHQALASMCGELYGQFDPDVLQALERCAPGLHAQPLQQHSRVSCELQSG
ncbi:MAG: divalent ion tolerance protein CutA [Paucimonas sp.]|nr:divalent ion tolerance protein CutA [Paucimonas sp.]